MGAYVGWRSYITEQDGQQSETVQDAEDDSEEELDEHGAEDVAFADAQDDNSQESGYGSVQDGTANIR